MCRNIKTLHNFSPPASDEEIRASALQFVRKLSGSTRPSKANQDVFDRAVDLVTDAARELLEGWSPARRPATVRSRRPRRGHGRSGGRGRSRIIQADPLRPRRNLRQTRTIVE
jgi:hypothetical protein